MMAKMFVKNVNILKSIKVTKVKVTVIVFFPPSCDEQLSGAALASTPLKNSFFQSQ